MGTLPIQRISALNRQCPHKKAAPRGSRLYHHQYVLLGNQSPAKWYLKVSSKALPEHRNFLLLQSGYEKLRQTVSKFSLCVNSLAVYAAPGAKPHPYCCKNTTNCYQSTQAKSSTCSICFKRGGRHFHQVPRPNTSSAFMTRTASAGMPRGSFSMTLSSCSRSAGFSAS